MHALPHLLIQQMSGALSSGVVLACKALSSRQGLELEGFHSCDRLSSLILPPLPPPPSKLWNKSWEMRGPPAPLSLCYSFPGVQIPGQPRIRQLHCQSVRKKNNKWRWIKRTWDVRWGARGRWEVGKEKETRWNKRKRWGEGTKTRELVLGMWAMLKPFNSNQHHVSSRALLSHKWTLLRQQSALELCKNIKGASPVSAWSQE